MGGPNISIVVPCYNSRAIVRESLRTLLQFCDESKDALGPWEILAVDDGSTDGTADLIESEWPRVHVIRFDRNRGKGAAVRRGMLDAKGVYRFFMDADLPFELSALPEMLRYLDVKEFDVVIGKRNPRQLAPFEKRSRLRRLASAVFTEITSRVVVTGVRDTQCGFKGFRAEVAEYLFSQSRVDRFAFDVEILYLAYKNDLDIKRVPVRLVSEDHSTVSVLRDGARMVFDIGLLPWRYYTGGYAMMQRHGD